jgi:hypothetical protein
MDLAGGNHFEHAGRADPSQSFGFSNTDHSHLGIATETPRSHGRIAPFDDQNLVSFDRDLGSLA